MLDYARAAKLEVELRAAWGRRLRRAEGSTWIVDEVVGPADAVVDIGASWGHYTAAMARRARRGSVHAFEPNPANRRQLELIALWHRNVIVHPVGLSDAAGAAELQVPLRDGRAVTELGTFGALETEAVTVRVPLARLDDVVPADLPVAFVKCDVEGHEERVFAGGARLLERWRPIVLVELERRHAHADVTQTLERFERMSYAAYMVRGDTLASAADFDPAVDQAGGPERPSYVSDFLFVPPGRTVAPTANG